MYTFKGGGRRGQEVFSPSGPEGGGREGGGGGGGKGRKSAFKGEKLPQNFHVLVNLGKGKEEEEEEPGEEEGDSYKGVATLASPGASTPATRLLCSGRNSSAATSCFHGNKKIPNISFPFPADIRRSEFNYVWHHNGRPIMVKGYKINKLLRVSLVEGSGGGEALFIRAADKAYTGIIRLNLLCPRDKEGEGEMGQQSGGLSIKRVKGRERSPLGQEREGGRHGRGGIFHRETAKGSKKVGKDEGREMKGELFFDCPS